MTERELKELIQQGESLTLEFKRDGPIGYEELAETAVCLANERGGYILLGVENDGRITGLHPSRRPDEVRPERVAAEISNKTDPPLAVEVLPVAVREGQVLVIKVPKASSLVALRDGRFLKRHWSGKGEPACRPMRPHEIGAWLMDRQQRDASAEPIPQASWDDLNPLELERLRQVVERNPQSDKALLELSQEELARALNLVQTQGGALTPTVAGLLLVGREEAIRRFVPGHEAAFQVLDEAGRVLRNEFFRLPLIHLFQRMEELFEAHNSEEELEMGLFRIPVPLYPKEAFREALANALVHRNYLILNAVYVKIDPLEGGLSIVSPGGFVEGVSLENLLVVEPRPRNPTLANAFKRLGLVERTGRGVPRIFAEVLRLGRQPPDYSGSDSERVKVVLPGGKADLNFVRLVLEVGNRRGRSLSWQHLLILRCMADEGELTLKEVTSLVQEGEPKARRVLEEMVEMGLVEPKGAKRGRTYHLSASVYKRLGKPIAYIHRRGIDRMKQEEAVLRIAYTYGKVRREDVLELLPHLTEDQATYLLRGLVKSGRLKPTGSKRGRYYVPLE